MLRCFVALDDRIALLRETNATLEAIAQALFKSWFVDFDPVRAKSQGLAPAGMDEATAALFPDGFEESALGLVPKGWKVGALGEIADLLSGRALQRFPPSDDSMAARRQDRVTQDKVAPIGVRLCAGRRLEPDYIIQDGDVRCFAAGLAVLGKSMSGAEVTGALNQHVFRSRRQESPRWLLPALRPAITTGPCRWIAASNVDTMGHIQHASCLKPRCWFPPACVARSQ